MNSVVETARDFLFNFTRNYTLEEDNAEDAREVL